MTRRAAGADERRRLEGGGCREGDEAGFSVAADVGEEGEQRRRLVEGAVAAEEGPVGDEAEPGLADEGGADEAQGPASFLGW
jgi:hypothetical protein